MTELGLALAQRVVRRHRLAERFLTDMLGLSWAEAHHEAGKWEHVMSDAVEAAMDRVLGSPTTCPHGNPIPGSQYAAPDSTPLSSLSVGQEFTVNRITEELEFTPGLLDYLEESAIQPGRSGVLTASSPDGTLTVQIDGRHVGVGAFASCTHPRDGLTPMRSHRRRAVVHCLLPLALAGLLGACGATTYDQSLAPDTAVATTTTVPTGTAADLLPKIREASAGLSGVMIDNGDDAAVAEQIDALWAAVRDEVGRGRPDLVDGFDQAVALVDKAVRYSRSADADKAARNLAVLVDAWFA